MRFIAFNAFFFTKWPLYVFRCIAMMKTGDSTSSDDVEEKSGTSSRCPDTTRFGCCIRRHVVFDEKRTMGKIECLCMMNITSVKELFQNKEGTKMIGHIEEFNKLLTEPANLEEIIKDEDKVLILMNSLPESYEPFNGLLYMLQGKTLENGVAMVADEVHSDKSDLSALWHMRSWIYIMKRKDEVLDLFLEWKNMVENKTGKQIKILRSDNGGEYTSDPFFKLTRGMKAIGCKWVYAKKDGVDDKSLVRFKARLFGVTKDTKPVGTPLDVHFKLSSQQCPKTEEEKMKMDGIPYANLVGGLMYFMVCTRLDIAHAAGINDAKWILRLKQEKINDWVCVYYGKGSYMLEINITTNTMWTLGLLGDLGVERHKLNEYCDNQSAIYLAKYQNTSLERIKPKQNRVQSILLTKNNMLKRQCLDSGIVNPKKSTQKSTVNGLGQRVNRSGQQVTVNRSNPVRVTGPRVLGQGYWLMDLGLEFKSGLGWVITLGLKESSRDRERYITGEKETP
ncbi:hypothetical protein D8674_020942 [Pyrus ussuriensis x Pyrus communis]|uniref:Integrase catalytic domain-containing protein n=1 Tax=Pyrus ussuriensis x Pyrus communis TaxID=2448454 RepID=A0A5N5HVD6_9ROSA|nr:hypothetical protein D8674_020942 [Pyrus ussuriensis x Pyrus communis]